MINKKSIFALMLCTSASMLAAPISPDQALQRIPGSSNRTITTLSKNPLKLSYTVKSDIGQPQAYIFTRENAPGYMILSSDDVAAPILGYSETVNIDVNNLPPALIWWLSELYGQVEYANSHGFQAYDTSKNYTNASMIAVGPLMKTQWDQDAPYNNDCPQVNYSNGLTQTKVTAPTGCVATAFAQVMKYFEYPKRGKGTKTYYDNGVRRTITFSKDFQWSNMLDKYTFNGYNDEQAAAVAYLMKGCGFTTEMMYGAGGSGTQTSKIVDAAINYFGYDKQTHFVYRSFYSLDQWSQMIYDNLKNVGPVIYGGNSIQIGHCFVCDGYDGNGYFHFNWGWSGLSDGYFLLDALNPSSQGIGGSSGGYEFHQNAVLGMQPDQGGDQVYYPDMRVYGSVYGSLDGDNIRMTAKGGIDIGWGNASAREIKSNVGGIFTKIDSNDVLATEQGYLNYNNTQLDVVALQPDQYYNSTYYDLVIPLPKLEDGQYKVVAASKDFQDINAPWQPMLCDMGTRNYCILTVENGIYNVTSVDPAVLDVENAEFVSPLYYGRTSVISTEITNDSDQQLTLCFYPALYKNGEMQYVSDFILATVDPNSTAVFKNTVKFLAVGNDVGPGTFELCLINQDTEQLIGNFGSIEMERASATTTVSLDSYSIEDAVQESVQSGSQQFDAYVLNDASIINILLGLTVEQGYLDTNVRIICAKHNPDTDKFETITPDAYTFIPYLGSGQSEVFTAPYNVSRLEPGYVYRLLAGYISGNSNKSLGQIYFKLNSVGIDGIEADNSEVTPEYFNMQGIRVDSPVKGQLLIRKVGKKITKIIF